MTMSRDMMPCTWNATRQLAARAMSENIWMLIAPPKGRAMAEMPSARLRRSAEEVDGCGAWDYADEHGAGDGAGDDVCGVEVPDRLHACRWRRRRRRR